MELVTPDEVAKYKADWLELGYALEIAPADLDEAEATIDELAEHHPPSATHTLRVSMDGAIMAIYMGLPAKWLYIAGAAHDDGKNHPLIRPLLRPGLFTPQDRENMKPHATYGYKNALIKFNPTIAGMVIRVHTYLDNGYPATVPPVPDGVDQKIFLSAARLLGFADFQDATHRIDTNGILSSAQRIKKFLRVNPDYRDEINNLVQAYAVQTEPRLLRLAGTLLQQP